MAFSAVREPVLYLPHLHVAHACQLKLLFGRWVRVVLVGIEPPREDVQLILLMVTAAVYSGGQSPGEPVIEIVFSGMGCIVVGVRILLTNGCVAQHLEHRIKSLLVDSILTSQLFRTAQTRARQEAKLCNEYFVRFASLGVFAILQHSRVAQMIRLLSDPLDLSFELFEYFTRWLHDGGGLNSCGSSLAPGEKHGLVWWQHIHLSLATGRAAYDNRRHLPSSG